jgi:flagellar basal body-associated protein FliL
MDERAAEIEQKAAAQAAKEANPTAVAFVSMDEMYANIHPTGPHATSHTIGMRLDLELFGEDDRSLFEKRQSGIKDTIIEASLEQEYSQLGTVAGKLYFKELLVSRLNTFFNRAVVRDIHFSSFYLQ